MLALERDQAAREREQGAAPGVEVPVDPRQLVVVAVGVVVAALRAAGLVAREQHRHALRKKQRRQEVAHLLSAQLLHGGVVGLALDAAVPAQVVIVAVGVVLEVRLVVLLVVADQVAQRESVVCGDEIDAGIGAASAVLVQVARAGQPVCDFAEQAALAFPVGANDVAVAPVPFGPPHREAAHLVAAFAEIPGLRDQLHPRDDRVLVNDVEERAEPVDFVELPRQSRGQVEAEAVDVHLTDPVAQTVHDQL